jgi:hypothetical protein
LQLPQLLKSNGVYWPMETWKSSKSWKHMCEALLFCADMSSKCAASHLIIESKKYIEAKHHFCSFETLWASCSRQLLRPASKTKTAAIIWDPWEAGWICSVNLMRWALIYPDVVICSDSDHFCNQVLSMLRGL